jgi:hypothetical protein
MTTRCAPGNLVLESARHQQSVAHMPKLTSVYNILSIEAGQLQSSQIPDKRRYKTPSEYYFRCGSAILENGRLCVTQSLRPTRSPIQSKKHLGDD